MGLADVVNYALFTNPLSANSIYAVKAAASTLAEYSGLQPQQKLVKVEMEPLWKLAANQGPFIRLAAISGVTAVVLGAYGSHKSYEGEKGQEQKRVFDVATKYHFFHTLALLGTPFTRLPYIAGTFFVSGIILFCGTCYHYAFTGEKKFSKLTPLGGACFILGWLALIF